MKKLLAILLALMMVLVSVAALAADGDPADGDGTVEEPAYKKLLNKEMELIKQYKVSHGTAPAETFTYKFTPVSYKDGAGTVFEAGAEGVTIPAIANQSIEYDAAISTNTEKSFKIDFILTNYELGVYTYKIEEVIPSPKTAGITYQEQPMYLVLTILSEGTADKNYVAALHIGAPNGDKTDKVVNTYDAGSLTVTKKTEGNMADLNKAFKFTITFNAGSGNQIKSAITVDDKGDTTKEDCGWDETGLVYTAYLSNSKSVSFTNLPAGITYTVAEDDEEYTLTKEEYSNSEKKIAGGVTDTATFTNTLTVDVDTGVALDSAVYMMIMALALAGFVALKIRRREEN